MIAFLTICYCSVIWLIFYKLKLLPFNLVAKFIVGIIGVGGVLTLLILMNVYQPYSDDFLVYQPVARIGARVAGRVVEVQVKPNRPLQQGDVLFRIDDIPYQAEVDRLKAALAEAEQHIPVLKAEVDIADAEINRAQSEYAEAKREFDRSKKLVSKGAGRERDVDRWRTEMQSLNAVIREAKAQKVQALSAYGSDIDGVNTTVAQLRAQLKKAEWELKETVVYAPANGVVTQVGLAVGSIVGSTALSHQMSFIYETRRMYIASFVQNAKRHMNAGDPVEIAFDSLPGKIIKGNVEAIVPAMGQGQIDPSGDLFTRNDAVPRGRFFVRFQINDGEFGEGEQIPIIGSGGAIAIYTDKMKAIRIVRKVVLRMYTWLNFWFTP